MRSLVRRLPVLTVLLTIVATRPAHAQLISPGKLATAHAQLEGMSNCTRCHELGKPGASDVKCLACHTLLKARIEKKAGFHATVTDKACASCHKEHFGTAFTMLKFDTAGFDHTKVGFELKLGHRKPACRACHKETLVADAAVRAYATEHKTLGRTFLGLATGCLDCHKTDDVHAGQFGVRGCKECHTEETWKKAPLFDHDRTKYALTGKHRSVACEKCHKAAPMAGFAKPIVRFAGVVASSCTTCHVDPHKGRMRQACESCHNTENWKRLTDRTKFEANFDHSRTQFQLKGAHAKALCAKCHNPAARPAATVRLVFLASQMQAMYPAPRAADCLSCHLDVHDSTFVKTPGGQACQNCHTETSWLPVSYDLVRHNRETYVLTGAHIAVACSGCHKPAAPGKTPAFRLQSRECVACHRDKDPHADQFPNRACSECHVTDAFRVTAFDHTKTRYPLDGAHKNVACAKCHTKTTAPNGTAFTRYRPLKTTCRSCHGADIPRRS